MLNDTICAPATPPINSPLGIIRISGSESLRVVNSIFNYPEKIKPRYVVYGSIIDNNEIIDDVVLVFYQNPQSFTGEDMVDIFCHGNPIIVKKIINLIIRNGAVMAEPGEFSKRAFINGKIDLTAAEAINQVITARSEWEISSSIRQMHGSLRDVVNEIKSRLILLKADIEAGIDFLEEDIEFISEADAITQLDDIRIQLDNLLQRCRIGEKISHGIDIPIIGKPNVGKSSILNLILNSERAIVSNIPGTTRDLINETIQFAGIRTNLFDTAGIDKPTNEIERKGIELSQQKIDSSSIIIMVFDAYLGINNEDKAILEKINNNSESLI